MGLGSRIGQKVYLEVHGYKWGYMSADMGYDYSYPTYIPIITTYEPPGNQAKSN